MGSQQILLITAKKYRLSNTYYIQILKMSLTFFHPYSMKPRYLRRKPINMDFDEFSIIPYFFNSCLDGMNLKLQNKNQNEDNEKKFVTKIKLKITAKNERKREKDGLRSYTLHEF